MPLDLTSFENVVARLRGGVEIYARMPGEEMIRDGLIQRFEFRYELAHKTLKRVAVFGSRAAGHAKPFSDLDLAIDAGRPLSLAELADLREAFAESDLPRKVDFLDRHATPEHFLKVIEATSVPLALAAR